MTGSLVVDRHEPRRRQGDDDLAGLHFDLKFVDGHGLYPVEKVLAPTSNYRPRDGSATRADSRSDRSGDHSTGNTTGRCTSNRFLGGGATRYCHDQDYRHQRENYGNAERQKLHSRFPPWGTNISAIL